MEPDELPIELDEEEFDFLDQALFPIPLAAIPFRRPAFDEDGEPEF